MFTLARRYIYALFYTFQCPRYMLDYCSGACKRTIGEAKRKQGESRNSEAVE
jgi:hypothetical protein